MNSHKTSIALAAIALFAAAPAVIPSTAQAAPTVSFTSPAASATISQPTACEATGERIQRVVFSIKRDDAGSWTTLNTDYSGPWRCNIDPSRYANGNYWLRAIAYDSGGASDTATRAIKISNGANTAPKVSFKTPSSGTVLPSGSGLSSCEVSATDANGIQKVEFFMNGALYKTDTGAAYTCTFSAGSFPNGSYTLKAVATDKAGAKGSAQISLTIGSATSSTNKAPSVSIMTPAANATLSAPVSGSGCQASAADSDGSVKRVDFFLSKSGTSTPVGSKTAAPYQCAIDTAKFADGDYTLMAVATDDKGAVASAQRALSISKPSSGGGSTSPINPADILTRASADVPFSQQGGYTAQVINTYTSASQIPEAGIHGATLPDGETLRLGKQTDPMNSVRKALAFQVKNTDPMTSSGKRAELSVSPNIQMNRTYWIAFSAFIEDWGTLATSDQACFGTQLHTGDNQAHVGGPSFSLNTTRNGRTFRVRARYSTSSTPTASNSVAVNFTEYPIPFGRWTDFVLKFRHNTNGNGLLQVWMDGQQIANYHGNLGFNTGMADYAKFGYYNWSGAEMGSKPRKVLLRSPTIVADPSGSTYSAEQVSTLLDAAH